VLGSQFCFKTGIGLTIISPQPSLILIYFYFSSKTLCDHFCIPSFHDLLGVRVFSRLLLLFPVPPVCPWSILNPIPRHSSEVTDVYKEDAKESSYWEGDFHVLIKSLEAYLISP